MKEDFLHFLWKFKLFNSLDLKTTDGEPVEVIKAGSHNHNSGPDFSDSKIRIGEKEWNGNVEIHIRSSDWFRHYHQDDEAYKNVILHAVYEHDKEVFHSKPGDLPVLELKHFIKEEYLSKYEELEANRGWVPCANQFPELNEFKVNQWLERLVINRFQRKSSDILRIYFDSDKDWNTTFYRWIARSFGFKINSDAMEELARKTPSKILKKHSNSILQVEAILMGQAGFLNQNFKEEHPKKLKLEYDFLSKKYGLHPMNQSQWKFSKTHPSNFPTKRIAQFAAFIVKENSTFSKILMHNSVEELVTLLTSPTSIYWTEHYRLDIKTSQKRSRSMGKQSVESLIINSISTMLFTYGRKTENPEMVERAITLLEEVNKERNSIIKNWTDLGLSPENSKHTQGLIELKREYCEKKKCLTCAFGSELLSKSN